jgi:hypothetical protein
VKIPPACRKSGVSDSHGEARRGPKASIFDKALKNAADLQRLDKRQIELAKIPIYWRWWV